MPNNYIAGFDPVAMGLVPIYENPSMDQSSGTGENATWSQGAQTGWGKELEGRNIVNYDMDGNEKYRGPKGSGLFGNMSPGQIFGIGALGLTGVGLAANAGMLGALGGSGSTSVAAATEPFVAGAEAFGTMAVPEIAPTTIAMSAPEATAGLVNAGALGAETTSTLGTLSATGYAAPTTVSSLTSGMTAGGATAGLGGASAAAGYGGMLGELATAGSTLAMSAIPTASTSLLTTIVSAVKDPVSYITKALGIEDTGLVKGIKEVLSIGGTAAGGSTLFDYLMKGLQGASNNDAALEQQRLRNQGAMDVANVNARNNLDILNLKDTQSQAANKRYSDSVSGLKSGLINSGYKPLTRSDGTRVFGGNGLINRG